MAETLDGHGEFTWPALFRYDRFPAFTVWGLLFTVTVTVEFFANHFLIR